MNDEGDWVELWAMADLTTPMAVRVAATLGIADHVADGLSTASQLAEVAGADADVLERVMRHLVVVGLFDRDHSGRYSLTELGQVLRDDHPRGMRRHLDIEGAVGRADLAFIQLLRTVRTGEPSYVVQFGRTFWDDLEQDSKLSTSFDLLMGADVTNEAPAIVAAYDWSSRAHIVDVGGGNGSLLIAMLQAFPTLRGTVVDLPGAVEAARTALAAAGLGERCALVGASFFDPLPAGAGGYLLSAIIHNWDDESARTILRRCAEAAGNNGRVFVVERIGPDGESFNTARDLRMLAYFGGRERNLSELTDLASDSGLDVVAVHGAASNAVIEMLPR